MKTNTSVIAAVREGKEEEWKSRMSCEKSQQIFLAWWKHFNCSDGGHMGLYYLSMLDERLCEISFIIYLIKLYILKIQDTSLLYWCFYMTNTLMLQHSLKHIWKTLIRESLFPHKNLPNQNEQTKPGTLLLNST